MSDYIQAALSQLFTQLYTGYNETNSDCLSDNDKLDILRNLSMTNLTFFESAKPVLYHNKTKMLLEHIVWGREDQAKAMLGSDLSLLLGRADATSEVGRQYNKVTPYELALYCGDTQMCEMMHEFFDKIDDGENARLEQVKRVFPLGVDAVIDEQEAYDFEHLIKVIHRASADDVTNQLQNKHVEGTELGDDINAFREEFEEMSKTERHSNLKHLLEAFRAYAHYERIAGWENTGNYGKMRVFWRQVIGFVQLHLPECDKQAFHQGFYGVVKDKTQLSREVDFMFDRGFSLHRVAACSSGCGFDFAASGAGTREWYDRWGEPEGALIRRLWLTCLENLCQTKKSNVENLCSRRQALRNHA